MQKLIKEVRDFMSKEYYGLEFDTDVLTISINTLLPVEREILENGDSDANKEQHESYMFMVNKVFNRHNDLCSRRSIQLDDETIEITDRSSITELDITYATLVNCNHSDIFHIQDIQKEILSTLTLEAIADVTAAIIIFNAEHVEKEVMA